MNANFYIKRNYPCHQFAQIFLIKLGRLANTRKFLSYVKNARTTATQINPIYPGKIILAGYWTK